MRLGFRDGCEIGMTAAWRFTQSATQINFPSWRDCCGKVRGGRRCEAWMNRKHLCSKSADSLSVSSLSGEQPRRVLCEVGEYEIRPGSSYRREGFEDSPVAVQPSVLDSRH
jgi:hypothetical protein